MVERGFFTPTLIKLSGSGPEGVSPEVQVLRVGKFSHPTYGDFEITNKILAEMKKNFDSKIRGVDIAIDYFHKSDQEAAAWFTELTLKEDGSELWAKVDWTQKARVMLSDRQVRYFSPDFAFKWQDPETKTIYKNVLFGGGLTNRPFVKEMAAIVAAEGDNIMTEVEKLAAQVKKLSDDNADLVKKLAELPKAPTPVSPVVVEDDVPTLKKKLAEMTAKCEELSAQVAASEKAKQLAEKETKFNLMLSEGRACAAQKDSFLKGDMDEFVKLAQPLNLTPKGDAANGGGATGDLEDRILKLAEEKCKANPKLDRVDAISEAQRELKK